MRVCTFGVHVSALLLTWRGVQGVSFGAHVSRIDFEDFTAHCEQLVVTKKKGLRDLAVQKCIHQCNDMPGTCTTAGGHAPPILEDEELLDDEFTGHCLQTTKVTQGQTALNNVAVNGCIRRCNDNPHSCKASAVPPVHAKAAVHAVCDEQTETAAPICDDLLSRAQSARNTVRDPQTALPCASKFNAVILANQPAQRALYTTAVQCLRANGDLTKTTKGIFSADFTSMLSDLTAIAKNARKNSGPWVSIDHCLLPCDKKCKDNAKNLKSSPPTSMKNRFCSYLCGAANLCLEKYARVKRQEFEDAWNSLCEKKDIVCHQLMSSEFAQKMLL